MKRTDNLLARLTDPEPITAEWLESEGWMRCVLSNHSLLIGGYILMHNVGKPIRVACGCDEIAIEIKSRGKLSCLIRGLGGES